MLSHDESPFRCGDQQNKRWFCKEKESFTNKGRGKSLMVSDFLVAHPSGTFFSLSDDEMKKCIKKIPNIEVFNGVNYVNRT